jgi:cell division protein FtsA
MAQRNSLIAALDVGSSKIACFIARIGDDGKPKVTGIGHHLSRGVRAGTIIDMEQAELAISTTINAAEQMAGETIRSVIVNLSGGNPASQTLSVEVPINGREIGDHDVGRVLYQGNQFNSLADRRMIHSIPVGYSIDGAKGIRDPRGMFGERLGVDMHVITAAAGAVRNLTNCVARCHLDVSALVVSPYAAGLAALVEDEIDLGVTVIDMGAGTTSLAVFVDGNVVYTDSVPIGGGHVTNDIARGLSTPLAHAERLKTLYGHCRVSPADEREMIQVPQVGEDDQHLSAPVPRSLLIGIIQPRLEETFELVRSRLEQSGFDKVAGRRVVLTGGANQLAGTRELAQLVLDKQVRMGRPLHIAGLADATNGPAFAAVSGLLTYAAQAEVEAGLLRKGRSAKPTPTTGWLGRFGFWLKENF